MLRLLARVAAVGLGVLGLVLGTPSVVSATFLSQTPANSSTAQNYVTASSYLDLGATLGTADFSAGKCVDSMFDWDTGPHHDGRLVRTCTNTPLGFTGWTNGQTFLGPQKAGGCIVSGWTAGTGKNGSRSSCEYAPGLTGNVATCGSAATECRVRVGGSVFSYVSDPNSDVN